MKCECGCGLLSPVSKINNKKRGWIKDKPKRFIQGHSTRLRVGDKAPNWKNGSVIIYFKKYDRKYILIYKPEHPNSINKYIFEHILIAEAVLGKFLPKGTVIHHINNDGTDNRKSNLLICQNNSYHNLLHARMIAIRKCGHPSWRKCWLCKTYDSPNNLFFSKSGVAAHRKCYNYYERKRYREGK